MIITELKKTGEKDDYIILSDGENMAKFEFIDMCVVNKKEYAALLQEGDDTLLLMRFVEKDGEEYYYTIENDAEFGAVYNAFDEMGICD